MATRSSTLAWKISGTEEPGGLQPMGSQRRTRRSNSRTHSVRCVHGPRLVPPPAAGPGLLPAVAAVSEAARICLRLVCTYSENRSRSGIAGSHGDSMFNILRTLHPAVHGGHIILHSHQRCTRLPFAHTCVVVFNLNCTDPRLSFKHRHAHMPRGT